MALIDHKLSDIIERPKFQEKTPEEQRLLKQKWLVDKAVNLRQRKGKDFNPKTLIDKATRRNLIDDVLPNPGVLESIVSATDELFSGADQIRQRLFSSEGFLRAGAATAQTIEQGARVAEEQVVAAQDERMIREYNQERRRRSREIKELSLAERDIFQSPKVFEVGKPDRPVNTFSDPETQDKPPVPTERSKRLSNAYREAVKEKQLTLPAKIQRIARAAREEFNAEIEEKGFNKLVEADAEKGAFHPNNIARMLNQSVAIALPAVLPGVGLPATVGTVAGFSFEEYIEAGRDEEDAFNRAIIASIPQALLERIVPKQVLKTANTTSISKFIQTMFTEGATEGAQRAIEILGRDANSIQEVGSVLADPDNIVDILQNTMLGMVGGGAFESVKLPVVIADSIIKKVGDKVNERTNKEGQESTRGAEQVDAGAREQLVQEPELERQTEGQVGESVQPGADVTEETIGQVERDQDAEAQQGGVPRSEGQVLEGPGQEEIVEQTPEQSKNVETIKTEIRKDIKKGDTLSSEFIPRNPLRFVGNQNKTNLAHTGDNQKVSQIKDNSDFVNRVFDTAKDARRFIGVLGTPISTRLRVINPVLKTTIRDHSFRENTLNAGDDKVSEPLLKGLGSLRRRAGGDYKVLKFAQLKGDRATVDKIVDSYGLRSEYDKVTQMLRDIRERAIDSGLEVGNVQNYWPRVVKDYEAFKKHLQKTGRFSAIENAIQKEESRKGHKLSEQEREDLISVLIRGFGEDKISTKSNNLQESRLLDIRPEDDKFYYDLETSLTMYLSRVNSTIAAREFFGLSRDNNPDLDSESVISEHVNQLINDKKIDAAQELEVIDILRGYFGNRGPHRAVQAYKNIEYVSTMGSYISTLTQLEDIAVAVARSGLLNTVSSLRRGITGKSTVTARELGLDKIAQELVQEASKSQSFLKTVFKTVGFKHIDRLSKETVINSKLLQLQRQARKGKFSRASQKALDTIFTERTKAQVIQDLKNGVNSVPVQRFLFDELLEVQPVSLTEMPEMYLKSQNAKLFYQLKTFMLKRFDLWRNEVLAKAKDFDIDALRNLLRMSISMVAFGMSIDALKDWLLGRETTYSDLFVSNVAKAVGLSKFFVFEAKREGLGSATVKLFSPAVSVADAVTRDVIEAFDKGSLTEKKRVTARIPWIGKDIYWRWGRGKDISDRDKKRLIVEKYDIDIRKRRDTRRKFETMTPKEQREFRELLTPNQLDRLGL